MEAGEIAAYAETIGIPEANELLFRGKDVPALLTREVTE